MNNKLFKYTINAQLFSITVKILVYCTSSVQLTFVSKPENVEQFQYTIIVFLKNDKQFRYTINNN